ncbi:MAG: glycosyltransferase family 2 protein [Clostridiales bacterium]|nr:glycosyltransferase family 2 protein [Clostridiales bacterium]
MNPVYSVVIPCYNEEEVITESYRRLTDALLLLNESYELIFINDGSKDKTSAMLDELADEDTHVRVIHFARNAGHQIAVSAGLDYAAGDAVVIIDADLQDPPELIPQMAAMWKNGVQVVYGKRRSRSGESFLKLKTADLYYKVMQNLTNDAFPRDTGDFRLVDRQVADVIRDMPEHARYLRGMFAWAGFRQEALLYDRDKRFAGETHYPLKKMLKLAADGIMSFSDKPLKLPLWLGLGWLGLSGITLLVSLLAQLLGKTVGLWWLAGLNGLIGGSILLSLGIMGGYIARIYEEAKGRPLYIVGRTKGFPDDALRTKG